MSLLFIVSISLSLSYSDHLTSYIKEIKASQSDIFDKSPLKIISAEPQFLEDVTPFKFDYTVDIFEKFFKEYLKDDSMFTASSEIIDVSSMDSLHKASLTSTFYFLSVYDYILKYDFAYRRNSIWAYMLGEDPDIIAAVILYFPDSKDPLHYPKCYVFSAVAK
jgi:hypothetical protein